MSPNRRNLMQFASVAVVAGLAGGAWMRWGRGSTSMMHGDAFKPYPFNPVAADNFQQNLFIPVASGPLGVLDVTGPISIRATNAAFTILPGRESPFLLYQVEHAGKAFQNPILRIESGAQFSANFSNELTEPTIIHWHGLHTPAAMDGHPSSTIAPTERFSYNFTIKNRGGTYWYHTHAHGLTAKQAYNGLASFFLVEDDDQRRLTQALALTLGETDLPIVIQDKQFSADGKLRYQPNMHEAMMGWMGDIVLCNLTPNAVLKVAPRTYRLRLLNGSNARIYRLAFVAGERQLEFAVIGTDGGFMERPEVVTEAFLAPGERLDVLFDATQIQAGADVFLKSLAFDPMENDGMTGMAADNSMGNMGNMKHMENMRGSGHTMAGMGGMAGSMTSSRLPLGMAFNVMKLSANAANRAPVNDAKIPAQLSQIMSINNVGAPERKIALSHNNQQFLINGLSFKMNEIAFEVKRGSVEIWRISNPVMGMPHPMHMHGFSFQVLERQNSPPQFSTVKRFGKGLMVGDLGWKDTVLVWPGETVRIAINFTHDFVGDQVYLFHCHNLEHEDAGMMINFLVKA